MEERRYEKVVFLICFGVCFVLLWLRSPNADNSYNARYVDRDGDDNNANAYHGIIGVRPASVI